MNDQCATHKKCFEQAQGGGNVCNMNLQGHKIYNNQRTSCMMKNI
jgi:hypothetical protein